MLLAFILRYQIEAGKHPVSPRGGGGVHKHLFDRDARPRPNFNYPEK